MSALTKENAATSAKVNGVKTHKKAAGFPQNNTPKTHPRSMSEFAKTEHKRAAVMLGHALTLADQATWWQTAAIWSVRLTTAERLALATSALLSLEKEEAVLIVNTLFAGGA